MIKRARGSITAAVYGLKVASDWLPIAFIWIPHWESLSTQIELSRFPTKPSHNNVGPRAAISLKLKLSTNENRFTGVSVWLIGIHTEWSKEPLFNEIRKKFLSVNLWSHCPAAVGRTEKGRTVFVYRACSAQLLICRNFKRFKSFLALTLVFNDFN